MEHKLSAKIVLHNKQQTWIVFKKRSGQKGNVSWRDSKFIKRLCFVVNNFVANWTKSYIQLETIELITGPIWHRNLSHLCRILCLSSDEIAWAVNTASILIITHTSNLLFMETLNVGWANDNRPEQLDAVHNKRGACCCVNCPAFSSLHCFAVDLGSLHLWWILFISAREKILSSQSSPQGENTWSYNMSISYLWKLVHVRD